MITEKDLQEAIAKCLGERNPNANTCIRLAAFYTIKNEMFGKSEPVGKSEQLEPTNSYSYSSTPAEYVEPTIDYYGDTDFSRVIDGRKQVDIWPVMDELMSTLQIIQPRLYDGVMHKLQE